jgi:hypothetical protein
MDLGIFINMIDVQSLEEVMVEPFPSAQRLYSTIQELCNQ